MIRIIFRNNDLNEHLHILLMNTFLTHTHTMLIMH